MSVQYKMFWALTVVTCSLLLVCRPAVCGAPVVAVAPLAAKAGAAGGVQAGTAATAGKLGGVAKAGGGAVLSPEDLETKKMERRKARWDEVNGMINDVKALMKNWGPEPIKTEDQLNLAKEARSALGKLSDAKRTESPVQAGGIKRLAEQSAQLPKSDLTEPVNVPAAGTNPKATKRSALLRKPLPLTPVIVKHNDRIEVIPAVPASKCN